MIALPRKLLHELEPDEKRAEWQAFSLHLGIACALVDNSEETHRARAARIFSYSNNAALLYRQS
jgi:hypothetical protein